MSPKQYETLGLEKDKLLFAAIEEIEGKVLSHYEVKQFVQVHQKEGRPCEEVVYWRLRPILHFKWLSRNGDLKHLKLYEPPKNENTQLGSGTPNPE